MMTRKVFIATLDPLQGYFVEPTKLFRPAGQCFVAGLGGSDHCFSL